MSDENRNESPPYRLAIRRPVTTFMLFVTLIVFGWRSYRELPINLMPDIAYPTLTVRTEYEGAAPEDVEKLVTRPLEEMLSIVSGMVEISSISSPGLSEIILEFTWDTDMNVAQQDVRDRLDLFDPPEEVTEKPVILRYDPTLDPVMRVAIAPEPASEINDPALRRLEHQKALTAIRDAAERHLKSDLEAESGIAQVAIRGGQEEEIQILVDAERLKNLGLSLQFIVNSLAQQNINLSGGRLREGKTEYLVRTLNEFQTIEEIGDTIISIPSGQQMRLDDVADVFLGTKERDTIVHINSREAVQLEIFKEGDANTVQVCDKVRDLLGFEREMGLTEELQRAFSQAVQQARMNAGLATGEETGETGELFRRRTLLDRLPEDIQLHVVSDQSLFIKGAIDEVKDATVIGGLLALAILFLFLRELKATVIIGVAIPISVIATFIPMFIQDITLNIMSLGGLALGVGMLVDNSIVVLESIFRCKEEGDEVVDAAERGTREVGSAVTASTLTTISVFFPIAFVEGIAGQLFKDLALTVTFSLLASLLTALYFVPLIASRQSLALYADRQVIWLLRAYRESRDAQRRGRILAFLSVLPLGLVYAGAYLKQAARDTFGPSLTAVRDALRQPSFLTFVSGAAGLLFLPFLVPLYICQVLLRAFATLLATVLFFFSLAVLMVWHTLASVFRAIFWLPLKLFDIGFNAVRSAYTVALRHSLRFNAIFLLLVLLIAVHAGWTATKLGAELIPPMKQGEFGIRMEARAGTRLEETEQHAKRIEMVVRQLDIVDTVTVEIGQDKGSTETDRGENIAQFTVLLKDPEKNAAYQDAVIERLRSAIMRVTNDEITFTLPSLFSFKTAVELQVVGDDLAELRRVGRRAVDAVQGIPGLKDVELSVKPGYPEIIVELDNELLANKGVTSDQVARRLRTEVQGEVATKFNRAGEKVDIRVRTDQAMLSSVEDLKQMSIVDGPVPIPLSDVATIREQEGPSEIRRVDQRQVVLITGNVEGRDLGAVSEDIKAAVSGVERPKDYYFMLGGQNRELETSYQSLRFALLLAIFLVYVVMACQFESIWHPALVMFSVPLAFIGVIYVLHWTGTDLSIMVFLGGIVLAGIVVNDAIVLVDYINQLRRRGYSKRDAIIQAGQVRLRPIIMTTVTTVLGLVPMVWSAGEGAEIRRPMAITVMAGLTAATVLTLIIIPMVYDLLGGRDKAPAPVAPPAPEAQPREAE